MNLSAISLVMAMIALGSSVVTLLNRKDTNSSSQVFAASSGTESDPKLATLRTEIQRQKADFEKLQTVVEVQKFLLQLKSDKKTVAYLDPTSRGYTKIDTGQGFLLVSCQDVVPYLDGQKVILEVGNPLGATFTGFKITATWGPRDTSGSDSQAYSRWRESLNQKEFSFPDAIEGGRWNRVELILPRTSSSSVGHIEVSIDTNTVSLLTPRK